jgi:hypothetical protein
MATPAKSVDIPIGRVELFGMVLHIVERQGHLVAACTDDHGGVAVPLATPGISAKSCRKLMRSAVDLLLDAAEAAFPESPATSARRVVCRADRRNCGSAECPSLTSGE